MGKTITASPDVKTEIETSRGKAEFSMSMWGLLIKSMNEKGPVDSLASIDTAIKVVDKLKTVEAAKAETLTLEDEEFKVLSGATKAILPTFYPEIARLLREFYRALEPKTDKNPTGVQDTELFGKK